MVEVVALAVLAPVDQTKLYNPPPDAILAVTEPLLLQVGSTVVKFKVGTALTVTVKLILIGQLSLVTPWYKVEV